MLPVVTALLLLTTPALAQDGENEDDTNGAAALGTSGGFSTSSTSWEGLSELVRLSERQLGPGRVFVRATLDYGELEPGDALLILHPEVTLADDSLIRFLAQGGRVALLDDFGTSPPFLEHFGIRRITAPFDPMRRLGGDPDLAIATPSVQVVAGVERGRHPMTEKVDELVTNHPAGFRHPDLTQVLEIQDRNGAAVPLAITGIIAERGRLVAMGDPSVFINLMLRYPGNRAFAEGLLTYLASREGGARGRLWIVSGHFDQKGSFGEPSLVDELNEKLKRARDALGGVEKNGLPPILSLLLGLLVLFWISKTEVFEELRSLVPPLPSFARPAPVAAQTGLLARAEVLSARTTPPVLVLLELLAAVEEGLAHRAGVAPGASPAILRARLLESGFGERNVEQGLELLAELKRRTDGFETGKSKRTSEAEMKRYHERAMSLLGLLGRDKRTPPS